MLTKLLRNTRFQLLINNFYKVRKEYIIDIILFGSSVKGKEKPADADILILSLKRIPTDEIYKLRKSIEKIGLEPNIVALLYEALFNPEFKARQAYLTEGYSLINNALISKGLGFSSMTLFKYELAGMSKSRRMQFYYSLYGRGSSKGMLHLLDAKKFSDTILIAPTEKSEQVKEYLVDNKIKYTEIPVLIPEPIALKQKN